jgi:hypothetical protein
LRHSLLSNINYSPLIHPLAAYIIIILIGERYLSDTRYYLVINNIVNALSGRMAVVNTVAANLLAVILGMRIIFKGVMRCYV